MNASLNTLSDCLAPAKLNLFLHITGKRPDGYHLLQTVFQLIDWCDRLHFTRRDDGVLHLNAVAGISPEDNLVMRAARLLQNYSQTHCSSAFINYGADIVLDKKIPQGAGLGGGSSDAATTLLALNRLWKLNLSREILQKLALKLGADVPFFVFGNNAFAEGIGEILTSISLPQQYFLIVVPAVHVATAAIFSALELTQIGNSIKILDFLTWSKDRPFGCNNLEPVVVQKYAAVAEALGILGLAAGPQTPPRMTGSGGAVFVAFSSKEQAVAAAKRLPAHCSAQVVQSLDVHPLFDFADDFAL